MTTPTPGDAPATQGEAHTVTITFQRAWDEWLPKCTCGWVGSYVARKTSAEREAAQHVENPND